MTLTKPKIPFLSSQEIRQGFLNYFHQQQHEIVPGSSLIPGNDPTLLFTNAGMVQFKDVFLGIEDRPYTRATSSQPCVRAGGKHNDLDRVGYTARHHTFFEMLGNFSFGDYFKREAIRYAWELLVDGFKLPPERLWVTVFVEDKETENIWLQEMKIDPRRFSRCSEKDNFWSMGPTGPCGPCTEIFYDHGEHIPGGPPGSPEEDGDRYVEIWNLVFMQYDRAADGTLTPLPKPSVDTGMGLERVSAVLQGVHNNYDTDLFQPLIQTAAALAHCKDFTHTSLRVIADHIRSCSFLVTDGISPSNEGRGYVLRRIIRRALRHGHQLGITEPFFYQLVKPLVSLMGGAYPALIKAQTHVEKILRQEEEQFSETLSQGLKLFEQAIQDLSGDIIPGDVVFKLYDTYGFPVDLTADMARERHLFLDDEGFETAMAKQRERSRKAHQFGADYSVAQQTQPPTEFLGHKNLLVDTMLDTGNILAVYREGAFTDALKTGEKGSIILDRTPFYAESGGQVGDQGVLRIEGKALFRVMDTIKQGQTHVHMGKVEKGELHTGDSVVAEVDAKRRAAIVLNHTATHILHKVLHEVLGEHAIQKGSLVEPERLRFDFAHLTPLSKEELRIVEAKVNTEIRANHTASVKITNLEDALASGAVGLFGEKYGKQVRVVRFGDSVELCGGTHAEHTGDIGVFKITAETGVAAGIRRIEAVTGEGILRWISKCEAEFQEKLEQAEKRAVSLEKEAEQLRDKLASTYSDTLAEEAKDMAGVKILATTVEGLDGKALRRAMDHLKQKLERAVIVLATVKEKKIGLVVGVTDNLTDQIKANEILSDIAKQIGGKGGGRADLAEGGGSQVENLEKALESVYDINRTKIRR